MRRYGEVLRVPHVAALVGATLLALSLIHI